MPRLANQLAVMIAVLLMPIAAVPAGLGVPSSKHPGYLHALTDLRTARSLLGRQPGDQKVYFDEEVAIHDIDAAIGEIKRASIDDGGNLNDHPNVDVREHGSRLLKAIETLKRAHEDIGKEEDNPDVRETRRRALDQIEQATKAADRAHSEWLKDIGQ